MPALVPNYAMMEAASSYKGCHGGGSK